MTLQYMCYTGPIIEQYFFKERTLGLHNLTVMPPCAVAEMGPTSKTFFFFFFFFLVYAWRDDSSTTISGPSSARQRKAI